MNEHVALKRWKVYLILLVVLLVGVLLLVLDTALKRQWFALGEPWASVPWGALSESFLGAFLIGLIYEGLIRRQSEVLLADTINTTLRSHRQAIERKLTVDSLMNADALGKLSKPGLDAAIRSVLTARLGDEALARELADSIIPRAETNVELTRNYSLRASFVDDDDLADEPGRYFAMRVRVSYTRQLRRDHFRFGITDSSDMMLKRIGTPGDHDVVWHTNRMGRYSYDNPRAFILEYVQVDDHDLAVTETTTDREDAQTGTQVAVRTLTARHEALTDLVGKEVRIAYCYVAKVPKLGHMVNFPLTQTCEGVSFEFEHYEDDIARATVVPFFLSATKPIVRSEKSRGKVTSTAATNSWVLPGGGIVFTWKLRAEEGAAFTAEVYKPPPSASSDG